MNAKSRIDSILKTTSLDTSVTGFPTFNLSQLKLQNELDFELPTNIRLGHIAEKIVSELIKTATNYKVVYENVQIIEEQKTIGEIDFILEDLKEKQLIHLELAYKFYLLDPSISSNPLKNWIGPNRNDSLSEKLEKLRIKQFPLLHHKATAATFDAIALNNISQALCLLASLFIPFNFKDSLAPTYQKAVKGYYVNLATFVSLHNIEKNYYLPSKKEWGMNPDTNETWHEFINIVETLKINMHEKQAPLCWQKQGAEFINFFIVWW